MVDVHNHVLTPEAQEIAAEWYEPAFEPYDLYAGAASARHNREFFGGLVEPMTDPQRRLRDMDAQGVDVQLLSIFVSQYYYWLDSAKGLELSQMQNQHLADLVATNPERFAAAATVPMQDPPSAFARCRSRRTSTGWTSTMPASNPSSRRPRTWTCSSSFIPTASARDAG